MSGRQLTYLVVDDERLARERLRQLLAEFPAMVSAGEASSGLDAIEAAERLQPDVVFLDIQMPGLDGLAVAGALRMVRPPRIVFVTAFDEYAIRAFEANAVDYLLKPVTRERLHLTVQRLQGEPPHDSGMESRIERIENALQELRTQYAEVMVGRQCGRLVLVELATVISFDVEDRLVFANVPNGRVLINCTLKSLEFRLDPKLFCRVHRQIIVNVRKIRQMCPLFNGNSNLTLSDGREIQASRNYVNHLKDRLLWA